MVASNIDWYVSFDEFCEALLMEPDECAAEICHYNTEDYSARTTADKIDAIYDQYHHRPGEVDDYFGLPSEVDLPEGLTDEDMVTEYLSNEYGFFVNGYALDTDP